MVPRIALVTLTIFCFSLIAHFWVTYHVTHPLGDLGPAIGCSMVGLALQNSTNCTKVGI